jgi:hypothetical protein
MLLRKAENPIGQGLFEAARYPTLSSSAAMRGIAARRYGAWGMTSLPIWLADPSANQMLPSGPTAMPCGLLFGVGMANSLMDPVGVMRPILLGSQSHWRTRGDQLRDVVEAEDRDGLIGHLRGLHPWPRVVLDDLLLEAPPKERLAAPIAAVRRGRLPAHQEIRR